MATRRTILGVAGRRCTVARNKTMLRKLVEGTDLRINERPSYIRISSPVSTVAYAFGRSDGSLRLQVRRPDGQYPDKLLVESDADLPTVREKLEQAETRLNRAKAAISR
jgi:hypothetical protein